jgi:hypothetical protein
VLGQNTGRAVFFPLPIRGVDLTHGLSSLEFFR